MVEIPKDCVLQWAGHAGYITEKFSGLLARQVLVDVTLICDEQKLRVHKLVLASNSIYFEEILQQDLGQEPIILLKDLDFEILKAMVEFMYCGETTISHQYLSSLLTAAKIFKVKELVSVIDTIVGSKKILDLGNCLQQHTGDCNNLKVANNSLANENDYVRVRCDKLSMEDVTFCNDSNNDVSSSKNQSLGNGTIDDAEHDSERTLYEEQTSVIDKTTEPETPTFSVSDVNISRQGEINSVPMHGKVNEVQTRYARDNRDEIYNNRDLKPILYEQCCDLSDVSERDQTSSFATLPQPCLTRLENESEDHHSGENKARVDVSSSAMGKCVKVYTHKRRRSSDGTRNKLVNTQCNLMTSPPSSTDSIDLLDEPSINDVPVTLLTSLDMESAEYILSLSKESIQSIVGGTISDQHTVIGCKKSIGAKRDLDKERSIANDADAKPILRRSTRLNQLESDETTSNGSLSSGSVGVEKPLRKVNSNGTETYPKAKRKGKEDRKVPDYNTIDVDMALQSGNKKSLKSKKSNSKLIVKRNNKPCPVVGTLTSGKEKEESKTKAMNSRLKADSTTESWVMPDRTVVSPLRNDSIDGIDRALWGDVSDRLDDKESETNLLAYPTNTEIPFAVGLLPLRTALEKMQAMPDYQPRKTRSSFAPLRDTISLKRKTNCALSQDTVAAPSKKQSGNNDSPKTAVFHIQIKTAPSQEVKSRNKSRLLPAGDGRRTQAITQVS